MDDVDQIERPSEIVADCELLFCVIAPGFHGHLTNVLLYLQGLEKAVGAGAVKFQAREPR